MKTSLSNIADRAALMSALVKFDLAVAGRTQGRTTEQTENWTLCRLLSTLAQAQKLEFPFSIEGRESPDFLLQAQYKIGIEITEAIPEQFARYQALAEREFPESIIDMGLFRPNSPDRTVDEMRSLLNESRLTSPGWTGDQVERDWAAFIQTVVDKKLKKLQTQKFDKFEQNWLAIYDNLPLMIDSLENAVTYVVPLLDKYWSQYPTFSAIFIESGKFIAKLTAETITIFPLNDPHHD